MKMYLIAIIVAFIGLWISSEVRADGPVDGGAAMFSHSSIEPRLAATYGLPH